MGNCLSCLQRHTDAQAPENLPVPDSGLSAPKFSELTDATQLTPFIAYVEELLSAVKMSSGQQPSTSTRTGTPEIVKPHVKFAADTMDKISSEGEKLEQDKGNLVSRFPGEVKRVVTDAMKGFGNLHWIAVGFSVIAFVLETMEKVSSNVDKAFHLLDQIIDLAKILQTLYVRMPTETEKFKKSRPHNR
eukprot:Gb_37980 [translate_table: standard]